MSSCNRTKYVFVRLYFVIWLAKTCCFNYLFVFERVFKLWEYAMKVNHVFGLSMDKRHLNSSLLTELIPKVQFANCSIYV